MLAHVYNRLQFRPLLMASFKDALIKDPKASSSRTQQSRLPESEVKRNIAYPDVGDGLNKDEDDLPDIDEVELPDCEKFENLYLIGKILRESVPLKTITSKTKLDWMPTGELKYVDMGNGLILIKFASEMDCSHVLFDQPWFVQGQKI